MKNDGGAAFPTPVPEDPNGQWPAYTDGGMTLRDYFAAAALTGLIPRAWTEEGKSDTTIIAQWGKSAYLVADSMLAARDGK